LPALLPLEKNGANVLVENGGSMKPNKLKLLLETRHEGLANKPRHHFIRRKAEMQSQIVSLLTYLTILSKSLIISHRTAYRIAQCKKFHTTEEDLIHPAAVDMDRPADIRNNILTADTTADMGLKQLILTAVVYCLEAQLTFS
jgi:hypothetical protein